MKSRCNSIARSPKSSLSQITGMVFAACMFFGLALGFATGYLLTFIFLGMGLGMIASAAIRYLGREDIGMYSEEIDVE